MVFVTPAADQKKIEGSCRKQLYMKERLIKENTFLETKSFWHFQFVFGNYEFIILEN